MKNGILRLKLDCSVNRCLGVIVMTLLAKESPKVCVKVRLANDNAAPPAARVSAATALLRFSRDSIELDDLAQRIETLEASMVKPTQ